MQLFWHTNSFNCRRTAIFVSYIISAKNADDIEFQIFSNYWMRLSRIIGYFTVGERGRFLFTSCVKQANERSEWLCFTQRVNRNRTSELAGSIFAPFSSLVYVPNEKSWLDAWAAKRVCDVNSQLKFLQRFYTGSDQPRSQGLSSSQGWEEERLLGTKLGGAMV